jgi:EAL domain-containing protein (putative c-di-GMP-specific phosphodiesterase class I)
MDGIELIRYLAEEGFQGALALVSGADRRVRETAARLAQARGLRVLGHLQKPVSVDALAELMVHWQQAPADSTRSGVQSATPQEVQRALAGGELRLVYQPQIDAHTGDLAGVEALVRWQHPHHGLLSPACFVPVAEEHGMVEALTRQVLELALRQARVWRNQLGRPIRMSVNVSMDNLRRLDFAEYVMERLAEHETTPQELVLEVTETRLMKDLQAPLDILTRLRMRGIGLSIDDFGTGHSSLAQLRDLPFDELKVDRGFVHGGRTDPTLRAILTGSVEMAQQLGLRLVAEGVEDEADLALVRQVGCNELQGYLVAMPMAGDALPQWLTDWPARRDHLFRETA